MKKKAQEIKAGDSIVIAGEEVEVSEVEVSDIGKQGTKKGRLVAKKKNSGKIKKYVIFGNYIFFFFFFVFFLYYQF